MEILVPSNRDDVVKHALRGKPRELAVHGVVGCTYCMRNVSVHVMRADEAPACLDAAIDCAVQNDELGSA